eukprot:jgi/Picsp_1/1810/NSC_05277-R1_30s ribosomal protein s16
MAKAPKAATILVKLLSSAGTGYFYVAKKNPRKLPQKLEFMKYDPRNLPFYRIFAADARSPRDGKHLENLGYYDPVPEKDGNKHVGLNIERIKYWLSVGAQPSRTVARLLGQAGVIPKGPTSLSSGTVKNPDKRNKTRVESSSTNE